MTQVRWTLFIIICVGVLFYFNSQEAKRIVAVKKAAAAAKLQAEKDAAKNAAAEKKPADAKAAAKDKGKDAKPGEIKAAPDKAAPDKPAPKPEAVNLPEKAFALGLDEDGGKFRLLANITTRGAVIKDLTLLKDPGKLLRERFKLLESGQSYRVDLSDEELGLKIWEYVEKESAPPGKLVFRTTARDGAIEVTKRYSLPEGSYLVDFELEFRNRSGKPIEDVAFTMDGPFNLPLEGPWYTQYYRRSATLLLPASGTPYIDEQLAPSIFANGKGTILEATPIKYAGVAVQYFASVVVQDDNPLEKRLFKSVTPVKLPAAPSDQQKNDANHSNLTVKIESTPIKLDPDAPVVQKFHLFNGPKEKDLLESAQYKTLGLDKLIVYMGFFGLRFDTLSNGMVWLVNKIARFTGDYGIAIILLTMIVRIVIFPLSFKQASTMQRATEKMQIIQPKMQEIREKYGNDSRKMQQELMELYRKHDYNPVSMFGGCLLIFLQMPIFVALYQALQGSFDLRQQPFHFTWIKDLSAPDMLFPFGFHFPGFGPWFNLLPFISLGLMMWQILMTPTPPAATPELAEQQRMSKKMTMFMMIFVGFMFYNVPAGLCLYIITSTAWGFLERKFIKKKHPPTVPGTATSDPTKASANGAVKPEASWKSPIEKKKKR